MRILFVLTFYRPHWTGLTQYAARLSEGLAKKNHQVSVLCSQHDKTLPLKEKLNGVWVYRLPFICRFLRSVVMPSFPFALYRQVQANDVVVVYLPLQEVLIVSLLTKIFGKKLYLVHNGDLILPDTGGLINKIIEKVYYLTTSFSIMLSDSVLIQSEDYSSHSKLLSRFKKKWKVVLPLYEIPSISISEVNNFIKEFGLKDKKLIGFSGRFVEEKGVDYLLKAIPYVIQKIKNAHFVFAGETKVNYESFWDDIEPLVKKYKQHITFLGLVINQRKLFTFYKSLEVLVQPSRTDCFPSSQIESLLAGTPSVCANIPGARWAVKSTGMGLLVKPGSPEALAEGVVQLIKNKSKYISRQKKVSEIFNYEHTLQKYEQIFKKS